MFIREMSFVRRSKSALVLPLMVLFSLFSSAVAVAQTTVSVSSVNFGFVPVGTTGTTHSAALKNTGSSPITIISIAVTPGGPYALTAPATVPCPSSGPLGPGSTCNIGLTLTPTALGTQPVGTLTITSTSTNSPQTVTLNGTGVTPFVVSPPTTNFGNVPVSTTSAAKTAYFTNYELAPLTINNVAVSPSVYAISSNTCGSSLASGVTCAISMTVTPTALGAVPAGTLTMSANASNSPLSVALSATGATPTAIAPPAENFGNVPVGTTSVAKLIYLSNYQSTTLTINQIAVTTPSAFAISGETCGATLASGATCSVSVTATPTTLGAIPTGTLTITSNASNSPLTVALSGTGSAPTAILPTAVIFGNVVVGATSPLHNVTLYNYLATSLTISGLATTAGTPYAVDPSSTCKTTTPVAAGGSCIVALTVTPSSVGTQPAGTLTISTNASNSPQMVPLSASGIASAVLAPTSLGFGNVVVNTTSAAKQIKITNNETSAITFSGDIFNGPFVLDTGAATTCSISGGALSGSLAAGASCFIGVDFAPTTVAATSGGQITVLDSASNSPQVATLSGAGVAAVSLSPTPLAFGNVVVATNLVKDVTLTNNQPAAMHLTSITAAVPWSIVAPLSGTACVTGGTVPANSSCTFGVKFSPTAVGPVAAATVSIVDAAASSPQSVTLTGAGVAAIALPSNLAFGNVVVLEKSEKSVTLTNDQSVSLTISSISGFTGGYGLDATDTTCSTTTALAVAHSCVIGVDLTAPALGAQPAASFSVAFGGGLPTLSVSLTASAIPAVELSPGSLAFPTTFVGLTSAAKTVTLTNEQSIPLIITSASISGANPSDFTVTTSCPTSPSSLPGTKNCPLNVIFAPKASGARTALLSVTDGVTGSPQTVALSGNGNAPVVVSPDTTVSFNANVGTTSGFRTFTITNEQPNTALIFNNLKLTGDFIQSATTCPIGGVGIGGAGSPASCTVSVEFDPTVGGVRDGQLQVEDNALTSPQVVNLTGNATNPLTISPGGLGFSAQTVGTVSAAKTITLTNHESQLETFTLAVAGSLAAGDYEAHSNCATGSIAAQSSCLIFINFTPTSITPSQTRGGSLTITNSAPGGSAIVAGLTGSAIATPPAAQVAVVSPGAGQTGTVVPVVITGNGWTHFSSSSTIAFVEQNNTSVACNIAVSGISSPNVNTLDATLTLSGDTFGACNIAVKTPLSGGGTPRTASLISAFNIFESAGQSITAARRQPSALRARH